MKKCNRSKVQRPSSRHQEKKRRPTVSRQKPANPHYYCDAQGQWWHVRSSGKRFRAKEYICQNPDCKRPNRLFPHVPHKNNAGHGPRFCSHQCNGEMMHVSRRSRRGAESHAWRGGRRITKRGYVKIYAPWHPYATDGKYVYEHRLIMEEFLGIILPRDIQFHHINGVRDDNRPENIRVWTDGGSHPPGQTPAALVQYARKVIGDYGQIHADLERLESIQADPSMIPVQRKSRECSTIADAAPGVAGFDATESGTRDVQGQQAPGDPFKAFYAQDASGQWWYHFDLENGGKRMKAAEFTCGYPPCGQKFPRLPRARLTTRYCSGKCRVGHSRLTGIGRSCGERHYNWNIEGRFVDSHGYVRVRVPGHPDARRNWMLEHRLVMEGVLGRRLKKSEYVHHRNGLKQDNRPENLQLWVRKHPPGQSVLDLLRWADEILRTYADTVDNGILS